MGVFFKVGLFSSNYNRPGPGVPKDAPKKKGIMRFFEIVGRDMGNLVKVNFLFSVCCIPMLVVIWFAYITWFFVGQYLGIMAICFVLIILCGMLVGPATSALHAVLADMVRDEPSYVWHTFRDKFKKNFKQAGFLGMFFNFIFCLEAVAGYFYLLGAVQKPNVLLIALYIFNLILIISVSLYAFLQEVYLDLKNFAILKNSLLLTFGMAKRSLPATLWVLVTTFVAVLFAPISGFLFFIFLPALIFLVADMWLWPTMESTFHISDLLAQRRDERFEQMDEIIEQ